jgi:hypothetical protein
MTRIAFFFFFPISADSESFMCSSSFLCKMMSKRYCH